MLEMVMLKYEKPFFFLHLCEKKEIFPNSGNTEEIYVQNICKTEQHLEEGNLTKN